MNTVRIGSTVYVYEQYRGERTPKTLQEHLYKWQQYKIVAETRDSWVAQLNQLERTRFNINKKTLQSRTERRIEWSIADIETKWNDLQFRVKHSRAIAELVNNSSAETLRQIADIVGYTAHKGTT